MSRSLTLCAVLAMAWLTAQPAAVLAEPGGSEAAAKPSDKPKASKVEAPRASALDDSRKETGTRVTNAFDNAAPEDGADGYIDTAQLDVPAKRTEQASVNDSTAPAAPGWLAVGLAVILAALFSAVVYWLLSRKLGAVMTKLDEQRDHVRRHGGELASLREQLVGLEQQQGQARQVSREPPAPSWRPPADEAPPPPPPPPPVSRLPETLEALRQEVSSLIQTPGLRSSDYEAALAGYGSIWAVALGENNRSGRLIPVDQDSNRRLSAVLLNGEQVAVIVPSHRYVREFAMIYKETLEAGSDVKTLFECRVDGSAALSLVAPAQCKVDAANVIVGLNKGVLAGFVG